MYRQIDDCVTGAEWNGSNGINVHLEPLDPMFEQNIRVAIPAGIDHGFRGYPVDGQIDDRRALLAYTQFRGQQLIVERCLQ